jgi:2,4-dienoyl-CoA reductase (NADPH2)
VRKGVQCVSNPMVGRETTLSITPAARARRVVIAGGGPAGMEAARIAALRGHDVVLLERGDELGGRLQLAARTYAPNNDLLQWLARQVAQLDIEVHLGTNADAAAIAAHNPDVVIDAAGGRWMKPAIDGAQLPHVRDLGACRDWVLHGHGLPPGPVVVIGGGRAGCGLADFAQQRGHETTVLEASNVFAVQFGLPGRWRYVHDLREQGITLTPDATITSIDEDAVHYTAGGEDHAIAATTVITVNRVEANDPIAIDGIESYRIGDCQGPRWLEGSLLEASTVAAGLAVE